MIYWYLNVITWDSLSFILRVNYLIVETSPAMLKTSPIMNNKNRLTADQLLMPDWVKDIYLVPEKSKGSYFYEKNRGRMILDLFSFFSTLPLGYNHPIFSSDNFLTDISIYGGLKLSTGRIKTEYYDRFVEEFHDYVNKNILYKYFFIHG